MKKQKVEDEPQVPEKISVEPAKSTGSIVRFEDVVGIGQADNQPFSFEYLLRERFQSEDQRMKGRHGDVCRFYSRGFCVKGSKCQYRHERNDKAVVCKHWLRGLCKKGPLCDFLHEYDLAKMPECYFFSQYGECTNDDCLYLHITNLEREEICPWYERGFCKHGHACRNRHVRHVMCERYLRGFCADGPNCMAGHPKYGSLEETRRCHHCGKIGHVSNSCPQRRLAGGPSDGGRGGGGGGRGRGRGRGRGGPPGEVTCFNCQGTGHMARQCPEPPNKRGRSHDDRGGGYRQRGGTWDRGSGRGRGQGRQDFRGGGDRRAGSGGGRDGGDRGRRY